MRLQLILERNQIANLYTYTLFNLISVNAHVEFLFHVALLIKILTTRKFRKNVSSTFQVLVFNTFFVLVTQLQSLSTKKEAHRSPQMSIPQHTTSSCWRLMTFCHHPHSTGTGTYSTRASLQIANTSPLHDCANFPTATVCGHNKLCAVEPSAFTRHLFFEFR